MLDIHPEPQDIRVEVRDRDRLTFVGLYERPAIYQSIHAARDALAAVVGEGVVARERSAGFEILYHFDSVDAWLAFRAERTKKEVDPALPTRARELLTGTSGELM